MTNPNRLDDIAVRTRVQSARDELARLQEADFGALDWSSMCRIVGRLESTVRELLDVADAQAGQ